MISPIDISESQICRQIAKLMFHTFLVHPTRAVSILDEDEAFATELVTSEIFREKAWVLGFQIFEAVENLTALGDPKCSVIPSQFPVLSNASLLKMTSSLNLGCKDPATKIELEVLRLCLAGAAEVYRQIYSGNCPTSDTELQLSSANLDEALRTYEKTREDIWMSFLMAVNIIDRTGLEFNYHCTHPLLNEIKGKSTMNLVEAVQFVNHKIFANFSGPPDWVEFSITKQHMIGNPVVFTLLNWAVLLLSAAPITYRLVEMDDVIRKRFLELYREVVSNDIQTDCSKLYTWLSSFE